MDALESGGSSKREQHVVFGVGPVGRAVIAELVGRGARVRAVTRSGRRPEGVGASVEVVCGDATVASSAREACRGATHVYNCTNARDYHLWAEQFPPLQRGVLAGAAASGARLIVVENLYVYGPHGGAPMTEETPPLGRGRRSSTRVAMTQELMEAHARGEVRVVRARASDLVGPGVVESMAGERLFAPILAREGRVFFAGNPDVPHSVTAVRDFGRALVTLGADERAFGRAWHVPCAPAITPRELVAMIAEEAGLSRAPKVMAPPRAALPVILPLLGLFVPQMRGISENTYMFHEPFVVDCSKYSAVYGDQATPLRTVVRETIAWYRSLASRPVQGSRAVKDSRVAHDSRAAREGSRP